MPELHQAPPGGKGGLAPSVRPLDFTDSAALLAWLADLRVQIDDAVAAGEDATRPLGRRMLGRRMARATIIEARHALHQLLTAAERSAAPPPPG